MTDFHSKEPEVLPGSNPETDCVPVGEPQIQPGGGDATWRSSRSVILASLERISLAFEKPVNALVGSQRLNPFYHTGTIAVFLWILVAASGLYLTMFYQFGFDASYHALEKLDASLVGRAIRTLHNYGSGMAMLVSLVHGWRLFFMDRFRGPRWLAWVTGVVMAIVLWLDGVTGYWLVWDQRSQVLTLSFTRFLEQLTPYAPEFALSLLAASKNGSSWVFMISVWGVHFLLFVLVAGFFWFHIVRLSRPRFLPAGYWMVVTAVGLVVASIAFPVNLLPKASFELIPGWLRLDLVYLFYIPLQESASPAWFWGGVLVVGAGLSLIPWMVKKTPKSGLIHINKDLCTGCTKCALDCPYKAIQMTPRSDGKRHKYVATENPALCVGCGVCVGSCDVLAVSVGALNQEGIWRAVETRLRHAREENLAPRVIFTCERHALGGAGKYLDGKTHLSQGGEEVTVIPLPCVAAAAPNLIARTLDAGAAGVAVVGCPPDDCARREGNLWEELRLTRKRLPKLKKPYEKSPISTFWAAPDAFGQVLAQPLNGAPQRKWKMFPDLRWFDFLPAGLLLLAAFLIQVGLNGFTYRHPWSEQAVIQIGLPAPAQVFSRDGGIPEAEWERLPRRLVLEVDGQVQFSKTYPSEELFNGSVRALAEYIPLPPGKHEIRLMFAGDDPVTASLALYLEQVDLQPGQILLVEDKSGEGFQDRHADGVPVR